MFDRINQSIDNVPVDAMPHYDYSVVLANKISKLKSGELVQPQLSEAVATTNNGEQAASTHEKKAKPVSMQNSQDDKQPSETAMEAEPRMNTSKIKAD